MKTIKLPNFRVNLEIQVDLETLTVISNLHEPCLYCGCEECRYSCDESQAGGFEENDENADENDSIYAFNCAIDALETFVLECEIGKIDIQSPAFVKALENTYTALLATHYS